MQNLPERCPLQLNARGQSPYVLTPLVPPGLSPQVPSPPVLTPLVPPGLSPRVPSPPIPSLSLDSTHGLSIHGPSLHGLPPPRPSPQRRIAPVPLQKSIEQALNAITDMEHAMDSMISTSMSLNKEIASLCSGLHSESSDEYANAKTEQHQPCDAKYELTATYRWFEDLDRADAWNKWPWGSTAYIATPLYRIQNRQTQQTMRAYFSEWRSHLFRVQTRVMNVLLSEVSISRVAAANDWLMHQDTPPHTGTRTCMPINRTLTLILPLTTL